MPRARKKPDASGVELLMFLMEQHAAGVGERHGSVTASKFSSPGRVFRYGASPFFPT
jgi:hypothetical protein